MGDEIKIQKEEQVLQVKKEELFQVDRHRQQMPKVMDKLNGDAWRISLVRQMSVEHSPQEYRVAPPVFDESLTSRHQQADREANQSKRDRKKQKENIEQHDSKVFSKMKKKIVKFIRPNDKEWGEHGELAPRDEEGNIIQTSVEKFMEGQFVYMLNGELSTEVDRLHSVGEIRKLEEEGADRALIRDDVTGFERRTRASKNKRANIKPGGKLAKEAERDVNALIHNFNVDLALTVNYEPSLLTRDYQDAYQWREQLEQEDRRHFGITEAAKKKVKEASDQGLPKDEIKKLEAQVDELEKKADKFHKLNFDIKNFSTQVSIQMEARRVRLKAMDLARAQLQEDLAHTDSSYTRFMLQEVDAQYNELEEDIKATFQEMDKPAYLTLDGSETAEVKERKMREAAAKSEAFEERRDMTNKLIALYRQQKLDLGPNPDGAGSREVKARYEAKVAELLRGFSQ